MLKKILFAVSIAMVPITSPIAGNNSEMGSAIIQSQSVYDWNGFYAGVQAGFSQGNVDWSDVASDPFFALPGIQVSHSPSGTMLGVFVGYNWQMENYLFGIEASGLFGKVGQSGIYVRSPNAFANSTNINSIVTVGPRVGFLFDNALFYVEGGLAAAEVKLFQQTGPIPIITANDVNTAAIQGGYYLGVGVELELNSNWAFGVEYNRIGLGDAVHPFSVGAVNGSIFVSGVSVDILTARLIKSF